LSLVVIAGAFVAGRSTSDGVRNPPTKPPPHASTTQPSAQGGLGSTPLRSAQSLREVDWPNATMPASVCGTVGDVVLRDRGVFVDSGGGGVGTFVFLADPIQYGDLEGDGIEEAAVPITCEGRHSGGPVLIYRLSHDVAS